MKSTRTPDHWYPFFGTKSCISVLPGQLILWTSVFAMCALLLRPAWGAGGDILWQEEFGGGNILGPNEVAVEGNRLYVAVAGDAYRVRAYEGKTGTLLWEDTIVDVPSNVSSANTVAADHGRVYVAGILDDDVLLRAYHAKTGRLLWQDRFDLAGMPDAAQKIAVERGRVYVGGVGTLRRGRPGDPGKSMLLIRAYDAVDGRLIWQDLSDAAAETQTNEATAIAAEKGRVYVVGNRDGGTLVRAYDRDTGLLLWQDQEQIAGFTSVATKHGQVYASGFRRYGLVGLFFVKVYDGGVGTVLWQDSYTLGGIEDGASSAIAISGKRVYTVGYSASGIDEGITYDFLVRAYDRRSGELLWQDNFHGPGFRTNVALAVDAGEPAASPDRTEKGDGVYVAGFTTSAPNDTEFVVRVYEGESGVVLWKDDIIRSGLDAALKIAAEKGRVYAAGYVNSDTAGQLFIRAYDAR